MSTPTSQTRYSTVVHLATPSRKAVSSQSNQNVCSNPITSLSSTPQPSTPRAPENTSNSTVCASAHLSPSPMLNPFEMDYEKMQHGIVTPGVFKKSEITPDSKSKPFRWDIEHVARLNPVDFGDVTERLRKQDQYNQKRDEAAQGVLDRFFQSKHIVPSPWSEPVQKVNLLTKIDEEERSMGANEQKRNAASQTDIHIPLSVDFNALFRNYKLTESQIEELNRGESFSNSSLRRKLFNNDSDSSSSTHCTPEKAGPSEDCWQSPPLGDMCASSPVYGDAADLDPPRRRCSLMEQLPADSENTSPNLSPITSPIKAEDKFHISDTGLMTESEADSSGASPYKVGTDMSVDLQVSFSCHHMQDTVHNDMKTLPLEPVGISMPDEVSQVETRIPSLYQDRSDTGYQTVSMNTIDLSEAADSRLTMGYTTANTTPSKTDADWEPPIASTPHKS